MNATVCYEQQTVTLPLLMVAGVGASLLGRNWLEKITLNWKAIHTVNLDQLQSVLNQYTEVFQPGVGMLKDYKAHIFIDPTVPPKFCKARSLPYAMKPLVETQLDKLHPDSNSTCGVGSTNRSSDESRSPVSTNLW